MPAWPSAMTLLADLGGAGTASHHNWLLLHCMPYLQEGALGLAAAAVL